MIRVIGKEDLLAKVCMPSECLARFRQSQKGESIDGHHYYWAIKILHPRTREQCESRLAHLLTAEQVPEWRRPGVRTIVPAYYKKGSAWQGAESERPILATF